MIKTTDYVTRSFLKAELKSELDKQTRIQDQKSKKYRDEILNGLDEVMGELLAIREDNTIGIHQTRALRENVDNHEKRITKLETTS